MPGCFRFHPNHAIIQPGKDARKVGSRGEVMVAKEAVAYEIPLEMREFADKSVEQARKAFDGFVGAAHRTVNAMDSAADTGRTGAQDAGRRAIAIAETNVAASFAFAQRLVRATDMGEVMQIQSEFLQQQLSAMQDQLSELGAALTAGPFGRSRSGQP
jgi:phasin